MDDWKLALSAATYLGRTMQQASPAVDAKVAAATLDSSTTLSRLAIEKILFSWEAAAAEGTVKAAIHQGGTLFGLKWRIGVALDSSTVKNLTAPYVTLSFNVRQTSGTVESHSLELTIPEFKNFTKAFKNAAEVMDQVEV